MHLGWPCPPHSRTGVQLSGIVGVICISGGLPGRLAALGAQLWRCSLYLGQLFRWPSRLGGPAVGGYVAGCIWGLYPLFSSSVFICCFICCFCLLSSSVVFVRCRVEGGASGVCFCCLYLLILRVAFIYLLFASAVSICCFLFVVNQKREETEEGKVNLLQVLPPPT